MIDRLLIFAVFVVASCGLAYELIAGALSSYLLGDSVLQFSTIIGAYLFAMGVGSHLSRYVADDDVLARFVDIEPNGSNLENLKTPDDAWKLRLIEEDFHRLMFEMGGA